MSSKTDDPRVKYITNNVLNPNLMKVGEKITQIELESSGYRIVCQFGCGYVLTKDGVDRNIIWDPKTLEIILIYTCNERYATVL